MSVLLWEPGQELLRYLLPLNLMFIILWRTVSLIHNPASQRSVESVWSQHSKDQLNQYDLNTHCWYILYCLIMVFIISLSFSSSFLYSDQREGFYGSSPSLLVVSPKWYISMFQLFWVFCIAPVHLPVTIYLVVQGSRVWGSLSWQQKWTLFRN